MRLLFLTPRLPWPPAGGDKVTVYSHIRLLSPLVESIHVLSLVEDASQASLARAFEAEFPNVTVETQVLSPLRSRMHTAKGLFTSRAPLQVHYYRSASYAYRVRKLVDEKPFDACYVHLVRMAPYARNLPIPVKVLCMTDCLTLRYERSAPYTSGLARYVEAIERQRITRFETACTADFDANIVVTGVDRRKLLELGAPGAIHVVPFGVDLARFTIEDTVEADRESVVFLGNLHSGPNRDAVRYFVDAVWPLVRIDAPEARFQIVGINAPAWIRDLHGKDGIEALGAVDDVRPFLRRATCSVCPMRIGAGIQTKNLESLALKTPVVSTPIGFEGLDAQVGEGVLVADSPREFADHILHLFKDAARRTALGTTGRRVIEERYDWNARAPVLYALLSGETSTVGETKHV